VSTGRRLESEYAMPVGDRATDPDTRGAVTLCKNVCKNRSGKGAKVDFDLRTLGD